MTALLIFPCNGNGVEALDCLGARHRPLGFVDDAVDKQGTPCCGLPVHPRDAFDRWPDAEVLAVPGSPESYRLRQRIVDGLRLDLRRFARVVHPTARVSPLASLGRNVLIMAGVVITSDALIGDHVCVLPNTVIHHGVRIGDWTLIGSNVSLAGHAVIGHGCYVGTGSSIRNGVTIGDGALVGMASNVLRDVAAGSRVAGNPARRLR